MPNPYLAAALRAQDPQRPKPVAPKTPEAPKVPVEKAATSAEKPDTNPPSEEN